MLIQFAGYEIDSNSRIYNFDVIDSPRPPRQFTVRIDSQTSRWGALKLQDGPSICFDRLQRALERETPESRAESDLCIGEQDIREYLARQNPREKARAPKLEQALSSDLDPTGVFLAPAKPGNGW